VLILMGYAVLENLGYRQMVALFRAQGVLQYFFRRKSWEAVQHKGLSVQKARPSAA